MLLNSTIVIDTSSREHAEWMASVWKANDERNRKLAEKK